MFCIVTIVSVQVLYCDSGMRGKKIESTGFVDVLFCTFIKAIHNSFSPGHTCLYLLLKFGKELWLHNTQLARKNRDKPNNTILISY